MKGILILLSTVCCSPYFVKAQINESDTTKFQLRVTLTGNFQRGNVQLVTIRSKVEFSYSPFRNWVFKSQNSSLYQEFTAKADNDIFSRNFLYFKPKNKVYPYAIAFISTNYRRKINSRFFAGAGITWQIINQPQHVLKLSANAVFESTTFSGNAFNFSEFDGHEKSSIWRSTVFLSGFHHLFEKHISLYYDAFWQPAFANGNDYRVEYEIGVDFPVWKGFSFNCLYSFKHENVVVTKIKQDDKILTFGFAYNFKRK
jgi:Protein of unknown function, DUF481